MGLLLGQYCLVCLMYLSHAQWFECLEKCCQEFEKETGATTVDEKHM